MLVEGSLDGPLRPTYHITQSVIRLVVYNVAELVMWDQLRKDVIRETLDATTAKPFDTDTAVDRLSKKLLTSSSFMVPITTFLQRRIDTAIADKFTVLKKATKMKPMAAMEQYGDTIEEPPSRLDSGSEEPHRRRSSRRPSKTWRAKRVDRHSKQHSHSTRSLKGKQDSQTESKSDEEILLMRNPDNPHHRARDSESGK